MKPLAVLVFGAVACAQAPTTLPHVVLTGLPGGNPSAQLVEVDPVSGATSVMPRFASDTLDPLAITFDSIDGALLVALDQGGGQSRIVRLDRAGAALAEHQVATLNGKVAELLIGGGELVAVVDTPNGGLFVMPRRGGAATQVLVQPNLTAAQSFFPGAATLELAWTGRAGTAVPDSGTGLYNFLAQAWIFGPDTFPNPNAVETTGVIDLVTAVPRQFLSFSDGSFALFAGLIGPNLQPVPTTPPIPAGGAVALKPASAYSIDSLALGGAAYPFLYGIDPFAGAVTPMTAALPGDPVDFAVGISLSVHSEYFGGECGAVVLQSSWSGLPQLGSPFTIEVAASVPSAPVFLAGGLTDFAGGTFPAVLPGGCLLEISPDVTVFVITAANGRAGVTFTAPAAPAFAGIPVFFQWVNFAASGLSVSRALVHWLGF